MDELGWFESGGMGIAPLSWQTINAWKDAMGVDLKPDEALLIRHLSKAYVGQYQKSKNPNQPSPVVVEVKDNDLVAQNIKSVLNSFKKQ